MRWPCFCKISYPVASCSASSRLSRYLKMMHCCKLKAFSTRLFTSTSPSRQPPKRGLSQRATLPLKPFYLKAVFFNYASKTFLHVYTRYNSYSLVLCTTNMPSRQNIENRDILALLAERPIHTKGHLWMSPNGSIFNTLLNFKPDKRNIDKTI